MLLPKPWNENRLSGLLRQGAITVRLQQHNLALTNELENRNRELRRFNQRLELLVDERTTELRSANQKLRDYQNQLVSLETQASITQLLRGLAHEFNNPLSVIMGYAQRLGRKTEDESTIKTADVIVYECSRCQDLINKLRSFTQNSSEAPSGIAVETIIPHANERIKKRGLEPLEAHVQGFIPGVRSGPNTLTTSLEHIFANARQANAQRINISAERIGDYVNIFLDNDGDTPTIGEIRHGVKPFIRRKGMITMALDSLLPLGSLRITAAR